MFVNATKSQAIKYNRLLFTEETVKKKIQYNNDVHKKVILKNFQSQER